MIHFDSSASGRFNGTVQLNSIVESAIDSNSLSRMGFDRLLDFVRRIPLFAAWRPGLLIRDIIRAFGLVKVDGAAIPVPQGLKALEVFDEKPVCSDIIRVNDEAVGTGIDCPAGRIRLETMIRPPQPDIVEDGILAIDDKTTRSFGRGDNSADATGDVEDNDRIGAIVHIFVYGSPDLHEIRGQCRARVEE